MVGLLSVYLVVTPRFRVSVSVVDVLVLLTVAVACYGKMERAARARRSGE